MAVLAQAQAPQRAAMAAYMVEWELACPQDPLPATTAAMEKTAEPPPAVGAAALAAMAMLSLAPAPSAHSQLL